MAAIIVLGQGRTGTSLVAGILHHLGVYMGEGLLFETPDNKRGSFEDARFVEMHTRMIGGDWKRPELDEGPYLEEYEGLVRQMQEHELWGLKDPRLCFTFPVLQRLLEDDTRIVYIQRGSAAVIHSLTMLADVHSMDHAEAIEMRYYDALFHSQMSVPNHWPQLAVWYHEMVDDPAAGVDRIAAFVGRETTQGALDFVDPTLRHWRWEGEDD